MEGFLLLNLRSLGWNVCHSCVHVTLQTLIHKHKFYLIITCSWKVSSIVFQIESLLSFITNSSKGHFCTQSWCTYNSVKSKLIEWLLTSLFDSIPLPYLTKTCVRTSKVNLKKKKKNPYRLYQCPHDSLVNTIYMLFG